MKRQIGLLTAAGILTVTVGIAAWMFASGQGWVQASPDRNRSLDRNQISDRNQTPAPVTPARQVRAELEVFAFEDAVKEADLIAKVEIGKLAKEFTEPSAKTRFQATVLDEFKADPTLDSNQIHIIQQGNSQWRFNDNDLFTEKDHYVLLLKKAVAASEPDTYWILGEETGMYQETGNGKLIKQALPDKQLEDIEDKSLTASINGELSKERGIEKNIQVVDESRFKEKVETLMNE